MKFIVTGANPKTGTELTREVEAANAGEAEKIAHEKGLLVSEVKPVPGIPYATPPQHVKTGTPAPAYMAMLALAKLLSAFGSICYVFGGVVIFAAASGKSSAPDPSLLLISGIGLIMYGLIIHAIGSALRALRDIAINSFHGT